MDLAKYAALFLSESREHLTACDRLLLEWERAPGAAAPVAGLFRAVHTVKGMAATMGYGGVAELAHAAEHLLDALRHGRVAAEPTVFALLFRAVDALRRDAERAARGEDVAADGTLLAELAAAAGPGSAAGAAPVTAPAVGSGPPRDDATERPVQVVIRAGAAMRGARAALVLRRAERLGGVSRVRPPLAELERDDFDGRLSFRLRSAAPADEILATIRAAGDVESVRFEEPGAGGGPAERRQIRVDLGRLDAVMKQVGELAVARNRLVALAAAPGADPELGDLGARVARLVSTLQAEVIAARMTPVGEVFGRFPRAVRDLAQGLGKRIRFDTDGEEIELDRAILDELAEPLLHLVRNAADHGIEPPGEREAAGKPAEGRILLAAARERNTVVIRVTDDGRGIDRDAILAKARREGVAGPEVTSLSDDLLARVLARPGFSTASEVTGVSGRGVGVDVAMTRVRAVGGTLEVRTELGRGTTFAIRVPLTLAIVRALLAEAGGERYALPVAFVAETVEFDPARVTAVGDREALVLRDRVVPTVHLRGLVGAASASAARRPGVVLELGERRAALVVDALLGQQEIVVEPFEAPRGVPAFVGGATILADGRPALVLDAAALV